MNKWVIIASYYIQKDYIAKNLCENRNKPQMHCEGKCCLKKRLAKEAKDQVPSPGSQKNEQEVNLFCVVLPFRIQLREFTPTKASFIVRNELLTISRSHAVFKPPTCIA
jgi:hypothetical protein